MANSDRIWVLGAVLLAGVILLGGWFLGIAPQLAAARAANDDRGRVEAQNAQLQTDLTVLQADYERIDELKAEAKKLAVAVPPVIAYADFIRELDALASANQVSIARLEASDGTPYLPPIDTGAAATPAPAEAEAAETSDGEAAEEAPVAPPAEPAAVAAPMPYTSPLISGTNFIAVPVTIEASGAPAQLFTFLHALQYGDRQLSVTTVSRGTESDTEEEGETMRVEGFIYVLVDPSIPGSPVSLATE